MNIEWTIMGKPVLISKLEDRCYGITVYRCRALDRTTLYYETFFLQTSYCPVRLPRELLNVQCAVIFEIIFTYDNSSCSRHFAVDSPRNKTFAAIYQLHICYVGCLQISNVCTCISLYIINHQKYCYWGKQKMFVFYRVSACDLKGVIEILKYNYFLLVSIHSQEQMCICLFFFAHKLTFAENHKAARTLAIENTVKFQNNFFKCKGMQFVCTKFVCTYIHTVATSWIVRKPCLLIL